MIKLQKLDLLISFYICCLAISELMGAKTFVITDSITIFGKPLTASVAIFVIPILFTINDVITEVLGKEKARSVVRSGLIMIAFLMFFSFFATILPPSQRFLDSEQAYDNIFLKSVRMSAASLIAFGIADFLDIFIFSKIREKLGKSKLWLRNNLSNFISQFVDTVTFMFLAFYSFDKDLQDNFTFLFSLIIPYWLLKSFMSIIETPFVYLGVKWLKNEHNK